MKKRVVFGLTNLKAHVVLELPMRVVGRWRRRRRRRCRGS